MTGKLYRSQTDKMLGGVCAGLAKYLNIDLTVVRLFFIVLTMLGGFGPLIYIILWIVIPLEGYVYMDSDPNKFNGEDIRERAGMMRDDFVSAVRQPNQNTARFVGIALIVAGAYYLLKGLDIPWPTWLNSSVVWAVLILLAGVALLVKAARKN